MCAFGNAQLARELRAPFPSLLMTNRDHQRWALQRVSLDQKTFDEQTIVTFLQQHALPCPVVIGDSELTYARQVREHTARFQVLLFHRLRRPREMAEERFGYEDDGIVMARAVREFARAATQFVGAATFVSYDFFDNDPDMAIAYIDSETELPVVVAVADRGEMGERTWLLSTKIPTRENVVELTLRAMRDAKLPESGEAAGLKFLTPPRGFSGAEPRESVEEGLAKFTVVARTAAAARATSDANAPVPRLQRVSPRPSH